MELPDCETPQRSWLFWPAFISAYYVGMIAVSAVDDARHAEASSFAGDSGIAAVSMYAFPFLWVIALAIKSIRSQLHSLLFAVAFPILAPLLTYFLLWGFTVVF
jgi:hypothetical protein